MLPDFSLYRPSSVEDAVAAIGEDSHALAGGTELLLAMKAGMVVPERLVDLSRLAELGNVAAGDDEIRIGAGATHRQIAGHQAVRARLPMLAAVEGGVGNIRVRSQGTIGGNLCFAEPRSDVATALIALGAVIDLVGPRGQRAVPVAEFITGPYTTSRADDELMLRVRVPLPAPARAAYAKFQTAERPTVGVALAAGAADGIVRLAIGAVAVTPALWELGSLDAIDPEAIAGEIDPMEDLTGAADYKRHVTAVYIRRVLAAMNGRGGT